MHHGCINLKKILVVISHLLLGDCSGVIAQKLLNFTGENEFCSIDHMLRVSGPVHQSKSSEPLRCLLEPLGMLVLVQSLGESLCLLESFGVLVRPRRAAKLPAPSPRQTCASGTGVHNGSWKRRITNKLLLPTGIQYQKPKTNISHTVFLRFLTVKSDW